jgi:predicted PurR-regulated permease PerM
VELRTGSTLQLVKAAAVIFVAVVVAWALYLARGALLLVYISVLLATGFSPLIMLIERQRLLPIGSRLPRWLAILVLYFFFLCVIVAILLMIVPPFIQQLSDLWARLPKMVASVQKFLVDHHAKIMERQVGLSPVAVIVALMVGAEIHGLIGAILAIPTTVILKVIFEELTQRPISSQQTVDGGQ